MMFGQHHASRAADADSQAKLDRILQSGDDARQYTLSWTRQDGRTFGVASGWVPESKAGVVVWADVVASAIESGWTPRAWWKFWRWDDSQNPPDEVIARAYGVVAERIGSAVRAA